MNTYPQILFISCKAKINGFLWNSLLFQQFF